MKSRTFRVIVFALALLLVGGMMASCKKEIVEPTKIEDTMVGQWDFTHSVGETAGFHTDGVVDRTYLDDGTGNIANGDINLNYWVNDNGMYQDQYYNSVTGELQPNINYERTISMPHKDTLVINDRVHVRI